MTAYLCIVIIIYLILIVAWFIKKDVSTVEFNHSIVIPTRNSNKRDKDIKYIFNINNKKEAIIKGAKLIKSEFIWQLDDDVSFPKDIKSKRIPDSDLIINPVWIEKGSTLFNFLRRLEYSSISLLTNSSAKLGYPVLCSGANLIYRRNKFLELEPFKEFINVKSGDDMNILSSFSKHGLKIVTNFKRPYCVYTDKEMSLNEFFKQRARWIKKDLDSKNTKSIIFGLLVFAMHIIPIFLCLLKPSSNTLILFIVKLALDVIVLSPPVFRFDKSPWILIFTPIISLFYPIYILLVLFFAYFVRPDWN
jgi:poly-beta-1,6-N-acetyl-D-glucosamine synthase